MENMSVPPVTIDAARLAKVAAKKRFARIPGLMGVGLTRQGLGYAVKVNLDHAIDAGSIPADLLGVPLVVEVIGAVRRR